MPTKTKHIILVIVLSLVVVVTAILLTQHRSSIRERETSSNVSTVGASNSAPFITNQSKVATAAEMNGKTNAGGEEGYFKTILDPQTGQYDIVNLDKQTITSEDKYGNILWVTNVSSWSLNPRGVTIDGMSANSNGLGVFLGKSVIGIDIHTG